MGTNPISQNQGDQEVKISSQEGNLSGKIVTKKGFFGKLGALIKRICRAIGRFFKNLFSRTKKAQVNLQASGGSRERPNNQLAEDPIVLQANCVSKGEPNNQLVAKKFVSREYPVSSDFRVTFRNENFEDFRFVGNIALERENRVAVNGVFTQDGLAKKLSLAFNPKKNSFFQRLFTKYLFAKFPETKFASPFSGSRYPFSGLVANVEFRALPHPLAFTLPKPSLNILKESFAALKVSEMMKGLLDDIGENEPESWMCNNGLSNSVNIPGWEMVSDEAKHVEQLNFIHYIWQFITNKDTKSIPDNAFVFFDKGEIQVASKFDPKNSKMIQAPAVFRKLLEKTYGNKLTERLSSRLKDDSKANGWFDQMEQLTWLDVKNALVGIAANVNVDDLKSMYHSIKQNQSDSMLCLRVLSPGHRDKIRQAGSFDGLKPEDIGLLLLPYRTLPKCNKRHHVLEVLFGQGQNFNMPVFKYNPSIHDAQLCWTFERIASLSPKNTPEYTLNAVSEHVSKNLAYRELVRGMVIPMPTKNNGLIYYTVEDTLPDENDGVICNLLKPINASQDKAKSLHVYLNFRGTQWKPSSKGAYQSLQRDVDPVGVGCSSYKNREKDILNMATRFLNKVPHGQKVVLHIDGHSLGATDVQRALITFMRALVEKGENSCLNKIERIVANPHNSPALERGVSETFSGLVKRLEEKNQMIPVELTYVRFDSDPVQSFGDEFVGACVRSEFVDVKIVELIIPSMRGFSAHGGRGFIQNKDGEIQITRRQIDNNSPDNALQKVLQKSWYYNSGNTFQKVAYYAAMPAVPVKQFLNYLSYAISMGAIAGGKLITGERKPKPALIKV